MSFIFGGGGGDPPPAPDYRAAAEETASGNFQNLLWQTFSNRPNQVTPWGSSTWTYGTPAASGAPGRVPGPATPPRPAAQAAPAAAPRTATALYGGNTEGGTPIEYEPAPQAPSAPGASPRPPGAQNLWFDPNNPQQWTQRITLDPRIKAALDSQLRVQSGRSQGAEGLLEQATGGFENPMDWGALPDAAGHVSGDLTFGSVSDPYRTRQAAQDAITKLQQPDLDRRRAAVETQLANQGIPRGSQAWEAAMEDVNDSESRAHLMAVGEGRQEADQMFGQLMARAQRGDQNAIAQLNAEISAGGFNNQGRQQALSETVMQRNQPLNELNALLSGQSVQSPNMPSFTPAGVVSGPNYTGAAGQQFDAASDIFNFGQAQKQSQQDGLIDLASIAASLFSLSDRRLKRDISHLFTLPNGIKVYKYRFLGRDDMEIGVLAQEVREIMPEAVSVDDSGYLLVNYSMVLQ